MAVNRDKILREAEKLVQKGKIDQAIREYEKLLRANPNDANTINRVGDLYGRIGQVDKAVELYERIAANFTEDGFTTKAIAILKKINRLVPQRLDIFDQLAELYIQQGLVVEAKNQYQILAEWYTKNDDLDNAIEVYRKLVQLDPENHMANLHLAGLLLKQGAAEDAIEVYDRLGRMLIARERLDEAERLYRHALEHDPPSGEFLAPLCRALLDAERASAARELVAEGLRRSPECHDLKLMEVRIRLALGNTGEAVAMATEILDDDGDDQELRMLVGEALLASGKAQQARDILLPECERLLRRGRYPEAQRMAQSLLSVVPDDPRVLMVAVRAYRPSGDEETLRDLMTRLADIHYRAGESDHARRLYEQLVEIEPDNVVVRERLGQLQSGVAGSSAGATVGPSIAPSEPGPASDEDPESVELDEVEVIEFELPEDVADADVPASVAVPAGSSPPFDPEERLAEAAVFAKYGLVEKAATHLEETLRTFPDLVEGREKLVSLYVEMGEREAAVATARPLLDRYRSDDRIQPAERLLASLPELGSEGVEALGGVAPVEPEVESAAVDDDPYAFDADRSVQFDFDVVDVPSEEVDAPSEEMEVLFAEPEPEAPQALSADEDAVEELVPEQIIEPLPAEPPEVAPSDSVTGTVGDALDELEKSLLVDSRPLRRLRPASPSPAASSDGPEVDVDQEEMVDISEHLSGPSLDDLQQFDFFVEQELYDDARRILASLEEDHPGDPEVTRRRSTLTSHGVVEEQVPAANEGAEDLFADEDEYIDLARELEEELAEEEAMVEEATGRGKDEALLEEVFREFQKGVSEQLSEEDSDTHFNLGIAYKEMGLLPEAIREFQVSSRDPNVFVESCSMIGVCYVEQGLWDQAAEWYRKALDAPNISQSSRLALRYDLGAALEGAGEYERAWEQYEAIAADDPGYRDVGERLFELSQQRQAN